MDCISVLGGFRSEDFLRSAGARYVAHTPADVLKLV